MSATSFFDNDDGLVNKALRGLVTTNPFLALDQRNKIVYDQTALGSDRSRVSLISGGGAGHEPGFAGFVGTGLLTAAVSGTIFASPSTEQIRQAVTKRVPTEKGVLILTMNYTGDVLNFGLAAEKSKSCGIATRFIAIGDDVGVGRAKAGKVGRRGIAGIVLVIKILGALAEQGAILDEVYTLANLLSANLVSVGASLRRVQIPGRARVEDEHQIPDGQVEVGMGIHNEGGSGRMASNLTKLVSAMLAQLLDPTDADRHYVAITSSDQVVLLINNLGGLSPLEVAAITDEVCQQAKAQYGIIPARVFSGTFLTSLNGLGWSATILKVVPTGLGPGRSIIELLDAPARGTGWPSSKHAPPSLDPEISPISAPDQQMESKPSNLILNFHQASAVLSAGLQAMIDAEEEVTRFDMIVGDGDCGVGLKRGATAVMKELSTARSASEDAVVFVTRLIPVIENNMDGTTGAIFAIFVNAMVSGLREEDTGKPRYLDTTIWVRVLQSALKALGQYTPATVGDRTFLDSLIPFVEALAATGDIVVAGKASVKGAEHTKELEPRLGRTVYVGRQSDWLGKIPDPGAWGLSKLMMGMANACSEQ